MGQDVSQMVTSPVARWMSTVGKVRELQGRTLGIFHPVVMKLLWIEQRGKIDCDKDISYISTRMKQPGIEDRNKLKRVLCFRNQKIDDKRIIGVNNQHKYKHMLIDLMLCTWT